jgi:hypothetical protein
VQASSAALAASWAAEVDSVFMPTTPPALVVGAPEVVGPACVVVGPLLEGAELLEVGSLVVGPLVVGSVLVGSVVDGPDVVAPDDDGPVESGELEAGPLVVGPTLVGAAADDDVVPAVRADAKLFVRATVASPPTAATTAKLLVFRDMFVLLGLLVHGTRPQKQRRPGAPKSVSMTHGTEPSENTGRHQRRCSGATSTLAAGQLLVKGVPDVLPHVQRSVTRRKPHETPHRWPITWVASK